MSEIKITKMVRPTFNRIITTANKYKGDATVGSLIDVTKKEGRYMDIQQVVAVGPQARDVEVGDMVSLSFERYRVRKFGNSLKQDDPSLQKMVQDDVYSIPARVIDGVEYFLLGDNDVEFVIPEGGCVEITDSPIIQPEMLIK